MNADAAREKLARTLGEAWITAGPRSWEEQSDARREGARHLAAALLPVVREIAAEELRAAAAAWSDKRQSAEYANDEIADFLRARAAALASPAPGNRALDAS